MSMKSPLCGPALGVALLLGSVSVTLADQSGTNAAQSSAEAGGAVAQLAMAQDLFSYGVAQSDALSVLVAARIAGSVTTEDGAREIVQSPREGADLPEEGEGADAPADAETMLSVAMDLAGTDAGLIGLIEDARAEGSRGRVGGAVKQLSRLPAGYRDTFNVGFYGGQLAEIAILGDGDADLDLSVLDENGNTICLDRSFSDQLYCSFTPVWTGNFTIVVDNVGRIRNSYYILTN